MEILVAVVFILILEVCHSLFQEYSIQLKWLMGDREAMQVKKREERRGNNNNQKKKTNKKQKT